MTQPTPGSPETHPSSPDDAARVVAREERSGVEGGRPTRWDWAVATFALVAVAAHDGAHVAAGRYWDTLWVCNVAALVVGPAILLRSPLLSAAALTWLVPGTIVWLADSVVAGSNILPTSYAVHLGGTAAALYAARVNGFAPRGWLAALALLVACVLGSRVALPVAANVNAAHAIPKGWSFLGGSRLVFAATATTLVLAACGLGRVLGAVVAPGPIRQPDGSIEPEARTPSR